MKQDKKALYESIMNIIAKEIKKVLNESVDAVHPHQEWYNYCFDALQESINRGEIGSDDNIDDNIYALIEFVLPNIDELPSNPDDLSEEDYAELEYWLKEAWTNVEFDEEDNEESEFEEVDESVKGKGKHINESFTLDDDLRQILRDFRTNIDMSRFYKNSFIDGENYEPHLQRIIDTYDPYVEEVIGFITCPDLSYAEQNIKRIAQDNEWENGTEANMVVDFLYDLYNWCEEYGLGKEVKKSLNENKFIAIEDHFLGDPYDSFHQKEKTTYRVVTAETYADLKRGYKIKKTRWGGNEEIPVGYNHEYSVLGTGFTREEAEAFLPSKQYAPRKTKISTDADYIVYAIGMGKMNAAGKTKFDWSIYDDNSAKTAKIFMGDWSMLWGSEDSGLNIGDKLCVVDNDTQKKLSGAPDEIIDICDCNPEAFAEMIRNNPRWARKCKRPSYQFGKRTDGLPWREFGQMYSIKGIESVEE